MPDSLRMYRKGTTRLPPLLFVASTTTLRRVARPYILNQIRAGYFATLEEQSGTLAVAPVSARIVLEGHPTPSRSVQVCFFRVFEVRSRINWYVGIRDDAVDWQGGNDLVDRFFDRRDSGSILEARGIGGSRSPGRHDGCEHRVSLVWWVVGINRELICQGCKRRTVHLIRTGADNGVV